MVGAIWVEGTAAQRQAGWYWGWKSGNWIIEMKSPSECTGHVESFSSAACEGTTCFSDCSCWTATARDGQLEKPAAGVNYGGRVVFSEKNHAVNVSQWKDVAEWFWLPFPERQDCWNAGYAGEFLWFPRALFVFESGAAERPGFGLHY